LTEHQDLSDYAKKSDIPDVSGFITSIPEEYITETELSAKGFLTEHQDISGKADAAHTHTLNDITDYVVPEIPSLEGYATEMYVDEAIAGIKIPVVPDLSTFITMEDVEARGYLTAVPSEYITETELSAKGYLTQHQSLAGLATEEFVTQKIAEAELTDKDVDLTAYYTKSEVDELIPDVTDIIKEVPSEYITESELATELAKLEIPEAYDDSELRTLINSKAASDHNHEEYALAEHAHDEYLTEQSLGDYAKRSELFSKSYNDLTDKPTIPSLEGYATKTFVDENYYDKAEVGPFISKVETLETFKTDVTANYATKQYVADAIETHEGIAKKAEVEEVKITLTDTVIPVVTEIVPLKANEVPFENAKFVGNPIGSFKLGDDLKGMTIAQIFAKLLGLTDTDPTIPVEPETPGTTEEIIADIVENKTPMYSVNSAGEIIELSYDNVATYTEETAAAKPEESGFYQITNEAGEVIESGYQEVSVENPNVPYIIALPKSVDFNTMVEVQTYDDLQGKWVENTSLSLSNDFDEISALCSQLGVSLSHIDTTKYTLWANLESGPSGETYRFIIK
jgi:hypothetical protein